MRNKYIFHLVSRKGSAVRQVSFAAPMTRFALVVMILIATGIAFLGIDYFRLKKTSLKIQSLEKKEDQYLKEIVHQRKQLQNFATEINDLKLTLLKINKFEKKIKIIANMDDPGKSGPFGVGGEIPEDLKTNVPLTKKHNSLLREMHTQIEDINQATIRQEEGFSNLLKYLEDQKNLLASTPAIRPTVGWVSSKFGYRISPFTGKKTFHKGLDIANRRGTPIIATANGVVSQAGMKGFLGNLITIDHGHGIVTRFGHLSKILVKVGRTVKRGDIIGKMGNSGRSTGPHVHYEVRLNGLPVNPVQYILNY